MSQYVQMNSIRGLFRAKDYCNYIREGNSDNFALENLICRGLRCTGLKSTGDASKVWFVGACALLYGSQIYRHLFRCSFLKNRNREGDCTEGFLWLFWWFLKAPAFLQCFPQPGSKQTNSLTGIYLLSKTTTLYLERSIKYWSSLTNNTPRYLHLWISNQERENMLQKRIENGCCITNKNKLKVVIKR